MTREQFEQRYAMRDGMTLDQFRARGFVAVLCQHCNDPHCQGWTVTTVAHLDWQTQQDGEEAKLIEMMKRIAAQSF